MDGERIVLLAQRERRPRTRAITSRRARSAPTHLRLGRLASRGARARREPRRARAGGRPGFGWRGGAGGGPRAGKARPYGGPPALLRGSHRAARETRSVRARPPRGPAASGHAARSRGSRRALLVRRALAPLRKAVRSAEVQHVVRPFGRGGHRPRHFPQARVTGDQRVRRNAFFAAHAGDGICVLKQ